MAPYRDKRYHTLSNVTRKAKNFTSSRGKQADLATGRERRLTTGKRAERTNHDFCVQFAALSLGKPVI